MSVRDDRAPSVPDCFGCDAFAFEGRGKREHSCARGRVEVPHRCNEYRARPLRSSEAQPCSAPPPMKAGEASIIDELTDDVVMTR